MKMAHISRNILCRGITAKAAAAVVFSTMMVFSTSAKAEIMVPGDQAGTVGAVVGNLPALPGSFTLPAYAVTSAVAAGSVPFVSIPTGAFSGTFYYDVYHDTTSTTGPLDFAYWVDVTSAGPPNPNRVIVQSFANFSTNVDYVAGSFQAAPTEADRSSGTGASIGFDFNPPTGIIAGQTTDYLIIKTNAMNITTGTASLIDDNIAQVSVNVPFGGTLTMVPEPCTIGLLTIASLGLLSRRRSQA